jgi:hypothetical protein
MHVEISTLFAEARSGINSRIRHQNDSPSTTEGKFLPPNHESEGFGKGSLAGIEIPAGTQTENTPLGAVSVMSCSYECKTMTFQ